MTPQIGDEIRATTFSYGPWREPKEIMRISRGTDGQLSLTISEELRDAALDFWRLVEELASPEQRLVYGGVVLEEARPEQTLEVEI